MLQEKKSASVFMLLPALICFLITHFNSQKITAILLNFTNDDAISQKILDYINPLKISIYFLCIIIIVLPVLKELKGNFKIKPKDILLSAAVFSLLFLAFFNWRPMSMGYGYAEMSVHPFDMQTGWYYKRLLMPALAFMSGFRNITPYFLFSQALSFVLIVILNQFLKNTLKEVSLLNRALILLSVCATEFVSFLFFYPGYADHLLSILIVLAFCYRFSEKGIFSLFLLSVCTHELSIFIFLPLIILRLPVKSKLLFLTASGIYLLIYAASFNFNLSELIAVHNVSEKTTVQWILEQPAYFFLGILISLKLLWLIIIKGIFDSPKEQGIFMLVMLLCSLLLCFMGVDTSRMMAFSFPVLLMAIPAFYMRTKHQYANAIMFCNLIIPYVTVGLSTGVITVIYFKEFLLKVF